MSEELNSRQVAFVVPHSPSVVGYDSINELLRYAEYHQRFCEVVSNRGGAVEFVALSAADHRPHGDYEFTIRRLPVTAGREFGRELSTTLARFPLRTNADTIHVHGYNQINFLQMVPALYRFDGQVVLHNHGGALNPSVRKHRVWYRLFARIIAPTADCVLSVNRREIENIVNFGVPPEKTRHLPNAVDTGLFSPATREVCRNRLELRDDRRYLLFVGRVTRNKGVVHLVNALGDLPDDVVLLLVYSGVNERTMSDVTRAVKSKGLEDRIRFVGAVDRSELPAYYGSADICVFPSIKEGFGIVVLEAMACARPVVGTTEHAAAGHLTDGETGIVVEPGSADELAGAVQSLLSDSSRADQIAETGRQRVLDRYTWERVADALVATYT